jgi:hypothetical protein
VRLSWHLLPSPGCLVWPALASTFFPHPIYQVGSFAQFFLIFSFAEKTGTAKHIETPVILKNDCCHVVHKSDSER